jgi:hypothetical protein
MGSVRVIRDMGFVQAIRETASVIGMAHGHFRSLIDWEN